MSYLAPTTFLQPIERISQGATSGDTQWQRYASFSCYAYQLMSRMAPDNSPDNASIHILDDDSLLNVFYLYQPFRLGEAERDDEYYPGGRGIWCPWWYKLAHVCQRWRNLILGSASYLDLSLVCKNGTPVADMLAHSHSHSLPLDIDYFDEITTDDEEGAILALEQRDRVRRVRLTMPDMELQELVMATVEKYPILEYLFFSMSDGDSTFLNFPETLQAPHLRHLTLSGFVIPIESRLLTTAVGLVTLSLFITHPLTYIRPDTLHRWLSSMPQLDTLVVTFLYPVPNSDLERQLTMHTPIMTPIVLHKLQCFRFLGACTYFEALVHRITAPRLEKLEIEFYDQLTFSVPRLVQFMNTTENLRFDSAKFVFSRVQASVKAYPRGEPEMHALHMKVLCSPFDWEVSPLAQISNSLSQMFSAVEHLTLVLEEDSHPSREHNEVDRAEWRKLLRSFSNVKALRIDDGLVEDLSRCLRLDDGELPLDLLPELQELTYSGSGDAGDSFTSFIDARQNAGRPITLSASSS
jgi:hypothetical protein